MSLNTTPRSNRPHISLLGKRNVGKSSVLNAITGQAASLISPVKGTTTDPVYKSMELLPLGPIVIIDTAGLDDEGILGSLRKERTMQILDKTDLAILIIDCDMGITEFDISIIRDIKQKNIPIIGVVNKIDLLKDENEHEKLSRAYQDILGSKPILISAKNEVDIDKLKNEIIKKTPGEFLKSTIIGDIISKDDIVILVTPIDKSAPKGRLILPQQQLIRDIIDNDAIAIIAKETELENILASIKKPAKLIITDSRIFDYVIKKIPDDVLLTSFSIIFAREKGDLKVLVEGTKALKNLKDGDKVLIAEACTHHPQEDDIGRVKIPNWLTKKTGKKLKFYNIAGGNFNKNIKEYAVIIHCGGCMINRKEMLSRINQAKEANIPIINYGVLISYVNGILERAIAPFEN